jgi:hypothetical protein
MRVQAVGSLLGLLFLIAAWPSHATNWLQFGYDSHHSGNNPQEAGYSTAGNMPLYSAPLLTSPPGVLNDSESAPVFLGSVSTPFGVKDLLFVTTTDGYSSLDGTTYIFYGALLAIDAKTGITVWSQTTSGTNGQLRAGAAIDPHLQFVYSAGLDGKIHKYSVADGTEILDAHWPEVSSLKPDVEQASSPLTFATDSNGNSYLYSAVSAFFDGGDAQGHVTTINLATGAQKVFNSQCSNLMIHFVKDGTPKIDDCDLLGPGTIGGPGQQSSIWGRGGVVYDSHTNRIYFATGNGLFDANSLNGREWGDSVLTLHPEGAGAGLGWPVDSYTPQTYGTLDESDLDLGSTAPIMLPSNSIEYPHIAAQIGKDGCIRILNLDNLSGASGPGHVGGELNAATSCSTLASFWPGSVHPAVWTNPADLTTMLFDGNTAWKLVFDGSGTPSLASVWEVPEGYLGGSSPVFANGQLYEIERCNFSCRILAFNATGGSLVWSFTTASSAHWQSPIIVNGHMYVIDGNGTLYAFALDGIFRGRFE